MEQNYLEPVLDSAQGLACKRAREKVWSIGELALDSAWASV